MVGNLRGRLSQVGTLFWIILGITTSVIASSHNKDFSRVYSWERLFDNFHVVQSGLLYRSAQLSYRKFSHYIKKFGIKTIINLRGKNKQARWWQQEKRCAQTLGVHLFDVAASARRPSTKRELCQILSLYDFAPKPILIHCHSGSDRTGEAAALWILDQQHKDKQQALKQLSWWYGHFQSRRPFKSRLIKAWKGRRWLVKNYHPSVLIKKKA